MEIALIGLAGTVLGVLIKMLYDLKHERDKRDREDVVWRRQHALDAAAELLMALDLLHVHNRTLRDLDQALVDPQVIARPALLQQRLTERDEQLRGKTEALTTAGRALSRLSLLLSHDAFMLCSQYFRAVEELPDSPETALLGAEVVDALRGDCGLPARSIPEQDRVSAEEAIARIRAEQLERGGRLGEP